MFSNPNWILSTKTYVAFMIFEMKKAAIVAMSLLCLMCKFDVEMCMKIFISNKAE